MNISCIALDLDGTLVRSDGTISDFSKKAVARAVEAGISVVIASGRIRGDAASFGPATGTNAPTIACNGSIIVNGDLGTPLLARYLDTAKSIEVIERIHGCGSFCHIYSGNNVYMERGNPSARWYLNRIGQLSPRYRFRIMFMDDLSEYLRRYGDSVFPNKIMVVEYNLERRSALNAALASISDIVITGSDASNREILPAGCSKGTALEYLARSLGLSRENIMAVGDNDNDLSMLSYAGYPVAMGNAPEHIKKAARSVTKTNNEDGAAHAILSVLNG